MTGEGARSLLWIGGGAGKAAAAAAGEAAFDGFRRCDEETGLRCCQGSVLLGGVDGGSDPDIFVRGGVVAMLSER